MEPPLACYLCLDANDDSGPRENEPCLACNRLIDHLMIDGADAMLIRREYPARPAHFFLARRENLIDG
jgi:hypothetical protein